MLVALVFFALANLLSFLLYFAVLTRVRYFIKPYYFHETAETKLFGLLTLRIVFYLYFATLVFLSFTHLILFIGFSV